jgi:four helix bundle protein
MESHKPHKKLEAWKRSFNLVKEIYQLTNEFPREEKFGIISQMRRCAVSIPSNIAEGAARNTNKEFLNFLHISLGSLSELDTLISLSKELNFISEEQELELLDKINIIGKLIFGLIKSIRIKISN